MKLVSIVGARPQFVKIAPLARAVADLNAQEPGILDHVIVHTGQHYDQGMSDVFFAELELPEAQVNLGVGSGSHGRQTGAMLERLEEVLQHQAPDAVIVYGDTNSTLAGALAACKLQLPTAHVESGLRSFKRSMPEEINRVVADHVCDLLLAPTPTAMRNLANEGLAERAEWTGDIMLDAVLEFRQVAAERATIGERLHLVAGTFGVVTIHRAENTDNIERLRQILHGINQLADGPLRMVFPAHPRTRKLIGARLPDWRPRPNLMLVEPAGYLDMLWLLDNAAVALTDSGGLQKEAFFLGCPCVTLREETEWTETVSLGGNVLVGVDAERMRSAVLECLEQRPSSADRAPSVRDAPFGRGAAAVSVLQAIMRMAQSRAAGPPQAAR